MHELTIVTYLLNICKYIPLSNITQTLKQTVEPWGHTYNLPPPVSVLSFPQGCNKLYSFDSSSKLPDCPDNDTSSGFCKYEGEAAQVCKNDDLMNLMWTVRDVWFIYRTSA